LYIFNKQPTSEQWNEVSEHFLKVTEHFLKVNEYKKDTNKDYTPLEKTEHTQERKHLFMILMVM
jgi:hypothetical protein